MHLDNGNMCYPQSTPHYTANCFPTIYFVLMNEDYILVLTLIFTLEYNKCAL